MVDLLGAAPGGLLAVLRRQGGALGTPMLLGAMLASEKSMWAQRGPGGPVPVGLKWRATLVRLVSWRLAMRERSVARQKPPRKRSQVVLFRE